MEFNNLEMVQEYPAIIMDKYPLRLYRSKGDKEKRYRYHIGFPEELVKPIHRMLECSPYWGEQHWKEDDGFWLWWLTVTSDTKDMPLDELNRDLKWRMSSANDVIRFYKRVVG